MPDAAARSGSGGRRATSSFLPPSVLRFRVETTASVEALEAVLDEIAQDRPRAMEIRHVKIDPRVAVSLSDGDLVLETGGSPDGIPVRAVVALDAHQAGAALVGEVFRPGAHAVVAAIGGFALFLVWQSLTGFPFAIVFLPLLAWIAIRSTRISGYNRRRAEVLIQTMTQIARLAEAIAPASDVALHAARERTARTRGESWFARIGGSTIIGWSFVSGWFAFQTFRFLRPSGVQDGFARVGAGFLFGALMGRAWFASRDWRFLGRWTPVLRGVVAGGTSAWLIADLRIPIGALSGWQILSAGVACGVLIGLWSESSEAPVE